MRFILQGKVRQVGKNAIDQRLIEIEVENLEKTTYIAQDPLDLTMDLLLLGEYECEVFLKRNNNFMNLYLKKITSLGFTIPSKMNGKKGRNK